jgi:hypothetical protein
VIDPVRIPVISKSICNLLLALFLVEKPFFTVKINIFCVWTHLSFYTLACQLGWTSTHVGSYHIMLVAWAAHLLGQMSVPAPPPYDISVALNVQPTPFNNLFVPSKMGVR